MKMGFNQRHCFLWKNCADILNLISVQSKRLVFIYTQLICLHRCIAVTTTLSPETLETVSPSLVRKEIRSVSLDDILNGGSISHSM